MNTSFYMNRINIILASDDNYAPHLATAMTSVMANCRRPSDLSFHILNCGLSEASREKIIDIGKEEGVSISVYNISADLLSGFPESGHLSLATYGRLFIADILPSDIKRAIYLDCDLVCLADLSELYNYNLQGKTLGAVRDVKSEAILRIYFYPGLESYFNAGVLLIDMEKLRQFDLPVKAGSFIEKYRHKLSTSDQDVLNCLFKDDWLEINRCFNLDMKHYSAFRLPAADTVILHYSDRIKPWNYLYCGRNQRYYFQYRAISPWPELVLAKTDVVGFFKKYFLAIKKEAINLIRPLLPDTLIDWHKRRFNRRVVRS